MAVNTAVGESPSPCNLPARCDHDTISPRITAFMLDTMRGWGDQRLDDQGPVTCHLLTSFSGISSRIKSTDHKSHSSQQSYASQTRLLQVLQQCCSAHGNNASTTQSFVSWLTAWKFNICKLEVMNNYSETS